MLAFCRNLPAGARRALFRRIILNGGVIKRPYSAPRAGALLRLFAVKLALLLATGPVPFSRATLAQSVGDHTVPAAAAPLRAAVEEVVPPLRAPVFRMQREPVAGGAELLTVFGDLRGLPPRSANAVPTATSDTPLVSVLRDTLGDTDPENDRLRYVWVHSYARPKAAQRVASAVPFLYSRVGNKTQTSTAPPPVIDLAAPDADVWQRLLWAAAQYAVFNPYGAVAKSSVRAFRRNRDDYRKAHVVRALAVLSLYEAETGAEPALTPAEMREVQARLALTEKTMGGLIDDGFLQRVHEQHRTTWRDLRGHNWELLRQRAEEEGLVFDPLVMPDGSATHAMLWVAREDLARTRTRRFNNRFLNFSDPWRDAALKRWDGYTETRYFDADNKPVAAEAPGARPVELIPLALYGLDHPKIPALLVDFRDAGNAKRREVSRRLLEDLARNVLSLSRFGDVHYFLGRSLYDFVTGKRGIDVNQPSRLRAYSQLKLLLSLSASLDPDLRAEIDRRVSRVAANPLDNDAAAEAALSRAGYEALLAHTRDARSGLPQRLSRDRRAELVSTSHGSAARVVFRLGNLLSFGRYQHREDAIAAEQIARLDSGRRLAYHRRVLRNVSRSAPPVEAAWDAAEVRRSLRYVAEHGEHAGGRTAGDAARLFARAEDEEVRRLCLAILYRVDSKSAKRELLRVYQMPGVDASLRSLSLEYLRRALDEEQRVASDDAKAVAALLSGR